MKKILAIFMAAAGAYSASAKHSKISADLDVTTSNPVPVIVQFTNSAGNDKLVTALGGALLSPLRSIKGGLYNVPGSALSALANNSQVAFISPDRPISAKLDNTAAATNAHAAWSAGFNGAGVGVAVIDSGINVSGDLNGGGPVYSYDFTQPSLAQVAQNVLWGIQGPLPIGTLVPSSPAPDQFGHGEHVAGIIASNGIASSCPNCTRTFKGVAYGAKLIDLKVLDNNGQGSDSTVILAIDTAIALKNIYNIRVINLSIGRPVMESYTLDPLCQAVEAAWKAGIVVVAAAGNDGRDNTFGEQGYGTINAPGNDPYVITVGAMKTEGTYTRSDDLVASYSSKGPTAIDHLAKPDILAPGNLVVSLLSPGSTLSRQYPANVVTQSYYQTDNHGQSKKVSTTYFMLSGTSMATPAVSAAAADLIQATPSLTPDQVKAILMETAYKTFPQSSSVTDPTSGQTFTDYYDLFTVGAGYLDLGAAMAMVHQPLPAGTAMSPVAQYDATSGLASLIFDASSIWSDRSMWGAETIWSSQALWGSAVLNSNQVIWDDRSMWGAQSSSAAQSIWDTRSMRGASSTADTSGAGATRSMWGASVDASGEN